MPRGVPKAGFRMMNNSDGTKRLPVRMGGEKVASEKIDQIRHLIEASPMVHETDGEVDSRIRDRFEILEDLVDGAISGQVRALIVSGPAGLGKSFTVEQKILEDDAEETQHKIVKGYVRAPSLYRLLYQHRLDNQVLVFDDADSVFFDDTALNILKAACDSNRTRRISYMTEAQLVDEETGDVLPKHFEYRGSIIFITNMDFDLMIARGNKLAPHMTAMMSRAMYIDLAMKTKRDYLMRIKQVLRLGMLHQAGFSIEQEEDILDFVEENQDTLRELSLRMVMKIGGLYKTCKPGRWEKTAKITCCK